MNLPVRLKTTEVALHRTRLLAMQGGRCALCNLPCDPTNAVLDHDHGTGAIRSALHRGCNSLLGVLENNHKRYGVHNVAAFLNGAAAYMQRHTVNLTGLLHPTFRTEDEKRDRRNATARKRRTAIKVR